MEITTNGIQDVSVVSVRGRIDAATAFDMEKELNKLILANSIKIIINFNDVEYISSGGLRILLSTAKALKNKNGDLRLCQLGDHVYKVFKLAGFTTIFNIYETEDEALKEI